MVSKGGVPLDDDTLFWELFSGEPRALGGYVTLPMTPGLGVILNARSRSRVGSRLTAWVIGLF
jgi:L-alanine-DL-glutamate epimerase-like enolase superfamily enzyme